MAEKNVVYVKQNKTQNMPEGDRHVVMGNTRITMTPLSPMFTISSVPSTVNCGHFAFKIDLGDSYLYISIYPDIQGICALPSRTRCIRTSPFCSHDWVCLHRQEIIFFHTLTIGWYINETKTHS